MDEDKKILEEITALEEEHLTLEKTLENAEGMDMLRLQRLKKRKLWLKDRISELRSYLHPDCIA